MILQDSIRPYNILNKQECSKLFGYEQVLLKREVDYEMETSETS